jgi:hypothetical protein
MFQALQLEVMDRFTAVEQHFRKSPSRPSDVGQTAKGLVFVQVYGIYEYTAKSMTRLAIAQVAACGHTFADLRPSLLALFLDAELSAVRDAGEGKLWEKRLRLLERVFSADPVTAVNAIPHDGANFKHSQIEMILKILGVNRKMTIRERHLFRIDELVSNRNRIAHGEETALEVGRRYSRQDIRYHIKLMQKICLRLIFIVSEHCSDPTRHCR